MFVCVCLFMCVYYSFFVCFRVSFLPLFCCYFQENDICPDGLPWYLHSFNVLGCGFLFCFVF